MSLKSFIRNLAQMSMVLRTLVLLSPALTRTIWKRLKQRDNICESLRTEDGGVELGDKNRSFKPVWKNDIGNYL